MPICSIQEVDHFRGLRVLVGRVVVSLANLLLRGYLLSDVDSGGASEGLEVVHKILELVDQVNAL
jgi:hypothetical protein